MRKKCTDYITHINNQEDKIYLKSRHFPVNMRLFKTSPEYKEIILAQCAYIRKLALTKNDGYKKPHGMSSANLGLSFNIIGIVKERNTSREYCDIMINPEIKKRYGDKVDALSNCGSLTLPNPIAIKRFEFVRVEWYSEDGRIHDSAFSREGNSFTIQHEIQHNLGILITDIK